MQIDRPISIAVGLLIVLMLIFFLVAPEYNTFKKLRIELSKEKAEFNAKFDYYAAITKTYFDLQSRAEDIKKIDDALPQESSLGEIVYFLQETAKKNGTMVRNLFLSKSSSDQTQGTVKEIFFSMDVLGDYGSLQNFISSLERSARIFEVTNISFGSSSADTTESSESQFQVQQIYTFGLQIKTHSY